MIKKHGRPITGARPAMRPRPPVLSDAADTSRDAQKQILQPPAPFANPFGPKNVPAPVNRNFSRDQIAGLPSNRGTQPSKQGGQATSDYSVHKGTAMTADEMAAVGYAPNATKSTGSIISGNPTSGQSRKVGAGNFPKAKGRT